MRSILAVVALSLLAEPAGAVPPPAALEPVTGWVIDYADNSCRLLRQFGTGGDQINLIIETMAPRAPRPLMLIGPGVHAVLQSTKNTVLVDPLGVTIKDGIAWTLERGKGRALRWTSFALFDDQSPQALRARYYAQKKMADPDDTPQRRAANEADFYARAAKVTSLRLTQDGGRTYDLRSGALEAPLKLLKKCATDSLKDWGIDPATDARIVKHSTIADINKFISDGDYPAEFLMSGGESDIQLRVLVGADGRVTKCTVVTSVNAPVFGQRVCEAAQRRAVFTPAEAADGTKLPDYYATSISFQMARGYGPR